MHDAIVVGAGAAGLAAARVLAERGRSVLILEARDRTGGRIFTQRDARCVAPIELGAEFIHGTPGETFDLLKEADAAAIGETGSDWERHADGLRRAESSFDSAGDLMRKIDRNKEDESVQAFLARFESDERLRDAVESLRALVEGFDAADPADASVQAIATEWNGGASLQHSQFRPSNGYGPLCDVLEARVAASSARIALQSIVEEIHWQRGSVRIRASRFGEVEEHEASCAIVTVPVGVLERDSIAFSPALPTEKLRALEAIAMGPVVKVVLRFADAFWQRIGHGSFSDASFFHGGERPFRTFWTSFPIVSPLVVAWAGGPRAGLFHGASRDDIVNRAIADLAYMLELQPSEIAQQLEAAYVHDWQRDPYSLGAYSYVKVGGCGARETLAEPVERTLYFAGEATSAAAEAGTVAGALASGYAAANAVLS